MEYTSIDIDLVRKHIDDMEILFGIPRERQIIYVRIAPSRTPKGTLAQELGVREDQISVYTRKRHRNMSVAAQYGNTYFTRILLSLLNHTKRSSLSKQSHKEAFLRGLFAAEGNVGIQRSTDCLSSLCFTLHSKEVHLQQQLEKCLDCVGISYTVTKKARRNCRTTTITSWKNYSLAWMHGIVDGCERKQEVFQKQLLRTDLHATPSTEFKRAIREEWDTIQQLATRTPVSYQRMLRWFDGTTKLTLQELISVATASNYAPDFVLEHIDSVSARLADEIVACGFAERYWNHLEEAEIIP